MTEKRRVEWVSPDTIVRRCPVFNPPPAADAKREPSAYAKLEQTNDDLVRELDAARAHIAELEAAQPDQGSLFGLDLKNDKPDNIADWPGREDRSCDSEGGQGQEPEAVAGRSGTSLAHLR